MNNPYTPPDASSSPQVASHLVWAILSTLFCCLPLGIVSIVHAAKVDSLVQAGNIDAAREASDKAKKWAIWSAAVQLTLGGLYIAFWVVLLVMGGVGASMK